MDPKLQCFGQGATCNVGPANIIKKRIKDCQWDKVVVKIHLVVSNLKIIKT